MGIFENFGTLDGLLQVIYHSTACFVLTSTVEFSSWNVELGLVGVGGRWWRGSWSEKDVHKFAGSKVSDEVLENFATRLANYIISGELSIKGWSGDLSSSIELQVDPTGKSPIEIKLIELPAEEGSARAITILKSIALQAQSRGCRINGSGVLPSSLLQLRKKTPEPELPEHGKELQQAKEHIKRLEKEVTKAKEAIIGQTLSPPKKPTAPRPPPGASRANPTRQKRKITEAEFESD